MASFWWQGQEQVLTQYSAGTISTYKFYLLVLLLLLLIKNVKYYILQQDIPIIVPLWPSHISTTTLALFSTVLSIHQIPFYEWFLSIFPILLSHPNINICAVETCICRYMNLFTLYCIHKSYLSFVTTLGGYLFCTINPFPYLDASREILKSRP